MTEVDRGECVHAERPQYQSNDEGDSKVSISTDSGKKIGQTIGEKTETNPVFSVLGKRGCIRIFLHKMQWCRAMERGHSREDRSPSWVPVSSVGETAVNRTN